MKYHLFDVAATIALAVLLVTPAKAEPFANDAIERYRLGDPAMFAFLAGDLNGLISANAELHSNHHAELFCVPPTVAVSVQQAVEMVSKRIKESPTDAQLPVGPLILQGLKQNYPCQ
jgi:Rap1a immunity proteins